MNGVAEQFESFTAAVTRAYKCLQKIKNRETERMGLKGSHVICLYYIGKTPGGLTAAELCRLCHEDKAAISRTLVDLTERGYLEPNVEEPGRKYRTRLTLTESGRKRNEQLHEAISRAVRQASEGLSDEDRACFYRVFFAITDRLEMLCRRDGE